ncbi:unnamed protein product [Paramecium pentaurelia]|uniref:Uncharacterized protein n=1 Tax=Paramecium pentaurelia TaxID=43138 RepID=A0A8S1WIM7_9CILI|nr:unnamed protein product [Paramecium pentaurelia]
MIHHIFQISDEERAKQEFLIMELGKQEYRDLFNGWVQQKLKFYMLLKKGENVKYIKDGEILKIESIQDMMKRKIICSNLDQQRYLRWETVSDTTQTQCNAYWKGELLQAGGFYNQMEQKEGKWIDLWENFWIKSKVFYKGNYVQGRKKGKWDILLKNQRVGGGAYNEEGQKQGEWTDIDNNFKKKCQVIYNGEYMNGRKCGQWKIIYNGNYLGGGDYNQFGLKNGKWLDLHEDFSEYCQVGFYGEYQNGRKIKKWNIIYRGHKEIEQFNIGNGTYNENGRKKGKWTELHPNFSDYCKVIYVGEYHGGAKEGKWDTIQLEKENKQIKSNLIGGGLYQCGLKIGKWIDLHEKYFISNCGGCKIIYKGEYQNDQKQGRWDIMMNNNQIIGGGNYNEKGLKHDRWIDLHENYSDFSQITYLGEYQNGQKKGMWVINFEGQIIGGGEYDQSGLKNGDWIDLHINFSKFCQVTYKGEYLNGIKCGMWQTCFENNVIGGGIYNEEGKQDGQWVDLHHNFRDLYQVVCIQEYQNGKKIGTPKQIELK